MSTAIAVRNVSKLFRVPVDRSTTLKYRVTHLRSASRYRDFYALRDVAFDVPDRVQHALPAVHRLVAVAQLDGLELARRGTRRHSRASERPGLELRFDLDRGVAARIENLARMDSGDRGSGYRKSSFARSK